MESAHCFEISSHLLIQHLLCSLFSDLLYSFNWILKSPLGNVDVECMHHNVYSIAYCRGVCLLCLPACHWVEADGVWPEVHICMYVCRAQELLIVGLRWWWCVVLFAVCGSSIGPQGVDQCSSMIVQFWMSEGPGNWMWDGDSRDIDWWRAGQFMYFTLYDDMLAIFCDDRYSSMM